MTRKGYTIVAVDMRDGTPRYTWRKDVPGEPAPPEHRPQRWTRGEAQVKEDQELLL